MNKAALLFAFALSVSAFSADLAGKWNAVAKDPDGNEIKAELSLKQEGAKLTGEMTNTEGTIQLENVQFKDNVLTYKLDYNGMPISVKMTLDGAKLKGNWTADGGDTGPIEAQRVVEAAAASPVIGDWKVSTMSPGGDQLKLVLSLKQEDGKWSGKLTDDEHGLNLSITDIKVDGASFTGNVQTEGGTFYLEAKVTADQLEGTHTAPDGKKTKMTGTR